MNRIYESRPKSIVAPAHSRRTFFVKDAGFHPGSGSGQAFFGSWTNRSIAAAAAAHKSTPTIAVDRVFTRVLLDVVFIQPPVKIERGLRLHPASASRLSSRGDAVPTKSISGP